MVVPLLCFRYRSIKVWKWGLLQRGAKGAVPSDLLFSPGMACSVASDPGEPVGFQKSVAWTTFFLILIFRSWCWHLWVGMLPFEQSWSFSVLLSLLYLVHRKRGVSPTQHYYNPPSADKEGESPEFPCPWWSGWLSLYFLASLLGESSLFHFSGRE